MHHDMLGAQAIGDFAEGFALLGQGGEDGVILDRVVRVDDLAMLAAEVSEAAVIGDNGQVSGFRGDLGWRDPAGAGPLDQLGQRAHIVPEMVVHHPQMQAGLALFFGNAVERNRGRTGGVVEKFDAGKGQDFCHGSEMAAMAPFRK